MGRKFQEPKLLDTALYRMVSCTYFRGEPTVILAEIMDGVGLGR